jgi:hypothetical protein
MIITISALDSLAQALKTIDALTKHRRAKKSLKLHATQGGIWIMSALQQKSEVDNSIVKVVEVQHSLSGAIVEQPGVVSLSPRVFNVLQTYSNGSGPITLQKCGGQITIKAGKDFFSEEMIEDDNIWVLLPSTTGNSIVFVSAKALKQAVNLASPSGNLREQPEEQSSLLVHIKGHRMMIRYGGQGAYAEQSVLLDRSMPERKYLLHSKWLEALLTTPGFDEPSIGIAADKNSLRLMTNRCIVAFHQVFPFETLAVTQVAERYHYNTKIRLKADQRQRLIRILEDVSKSGEMAELSIRNGQLIIRNGRNQKLWLEHRLGVSIQGRPHCSPMLLNSKALLKRLISLGGEDLELRFLPTQLAVQPVGRYDSVSLFSPIENTKFEPRNRIQFYASGGGLDLHQKAGTRHILLDFLNLPEPVQRCEQSFAEYLGALNLDEVSIMLDSGAFAAEFNATLKAKVEADRESYLRNHLNFVKCNRSLLTIYNSLDFYSGTMSENIESYQRMREEGLSPLYVFHYGESYDLLREFIRTEQPKQIGWGGAATAHSAARLDYVQRALRCLFEESENPESVFIHGFALSSFLPDKEAMLLRFPFDSCDSVSWSRWSQNGQLATPWGLFSLSKRQTDCVFDHPLRSEIQEFAKSLEFANEFGEFRFELKQLASSLELLQIYHLQFLNYLGEHLRYMGHMVDKRHYIPSDELKKMGPCTVGAKPLYWPKTDYQLIRMKRTAQEVR